MSKKMIRTRGIVSSLLLLVFLVCAVTGIMMDSGPKKEFNHGVVQSGSMGVEISGVAGGPEKIENSGVGQSFNLKEMHRITGYLLGALAVFHFVLNFRMYLGEIKI